MRATSMALLIIDMQNDFVLPKGVLHVAGAQATIPVIQRILHVFRQTGRPVFHITREYRPDGSDVENMRRKKFLEERPFVVPGTWGWQIAEQLTPLPGEYRIIKNRFSAFMFTELDLMLRRLGLAHLVITGTQLPNCVRATVFDALSLDYEVTLITDGCSAQTPEIAAANIRDMAHVGVQCMDSKQFLNGL
ncbi:cysteine hydrolase family protein [Desulfoplanes formicivorans]|uniref:Isochorismatase n=1 Tax=Desulfoplanes formicivorans TaxID=1592317 RepID=A0A194AJF1_9BACT|nr:isochorismatase family cysteine hydrolase [Desulfoplanes formicivorans]GAU08874.1 isochorismatase [Desulfoplanes formicivorans]